VASLLAGSEGRVLHAECGNGWLVQALTDAGCDVYGVDADRAAVPIDSELELRVDDPLDHLGVLPDGALGALVVSGIVDRFPAPALTSLVSLARARVAPGGRFVVVGTDPRTWRAGVDPVLADLSPGRPLYAETWSHLLSAHGFADVGAESGAVTDVIGDGFDERTHRLAELVVGRGTYVVVGTRPR
jgi:SAM-dependent methyltransferase